MLAASNPCAILAIRWITFMMVVLRELIRFDERYSAPPADAQQSRSLIIR
jgi:hypothetical protein